MIDRSKLHRQQLKELNNEVTAHTSALAPLSFNAMAVAMRAHRLAPRDTERIYESSQVHQTFVRANRRHPDEETLP